jgi:hypothetical protein
MVGLAALAACGWLWIARPVLRGRHDGSGAPDEAPGG